MDWHLLVSTLDLYWGLLPGAGITPECPWEAWGGPCGLPTFLLAALGSRRWEGGWGKEGVCPPPPSPQATRSEPLEWHLSRWTYDDPGKGSLEGLPAGGQPCADAKLGKERKTVSFAWARKKDDFFLSPPILFSCKDNKKLWFPLYKWQTLTRETQPATAPGSAPATMAPSCFLHTLHLLFPLPETFFPQTFSLSPLLPIFARASFSQ